VVTVPRASDLGELDIVSVWSMLGGGPLHGKRGQAFWRKGDGYNIALDPAKGAWFDHRDGRGGGILALVETALGGSRSSALQWLKENCGLDARPSFSQERRANHVKHIVRRSKAESWGITAWTLGEKLLDELEADDPDRVDYTRLLDIIRTGGPKLIEEYHTWAQIRPELTQAMVRAGMFSQARVQRRLALYLLELADAA
jgi:hypothetical protein